MLRFLVAASAFTSTYAVPTTVKNSLVAEEVRMIDGSAPTPAVLALWTQLREEGNTTAGIEMIAHGIVQEEGWKSRMQNSINRAKDKARNLQNKVNDLENVKRRIEDAKNRAEDLKNKAEAKLGPITDKYNKAKAAVEKAKGAITNIKDSVENMGGCLAKMPNSEKPFKEITDIGAEFKVGGAAAVRARLMTKTINPFMEQANAAVDSAVDGMQNISESMSNLFQAGKLDPAVLASLPGQVINLVVMQKVHFPVLDCLLANDGFMSDVSKVVSAIVPFIVGLAEKAKTMLMNLMKRLVGPTSPFGKFVTKVAKESAAKFLPKLEAVELRIGNAIQSVCQKQSRKMLEIAEGKSDSKLFCAAAGDETSTENKEMLSAAFSEGMIAAADYVIAALNKHVWMPLLQKMSAMLIAAEDFIMQLVDGVAGLIPEVGGIIATSMTAVVSQVSAKISEVLSDEAVTKIADTMSATINTEIPIWSAQLADSIQTQTDAAKASIGAAKTEAVAPFLAFKGKVSPLAAPLMGVLSPLFTTFANTVLPTITVATTTCAKDIKALTAIVKATACKAD